MSDLGGSGLDAIARDLASGAISRRAALRRFGGVALAAVVPGALFTDSAFARCPKSRRCDGRCCAQHAHCAHGKCKCDAGFTKCGKKCRNLKTDERNCGSCGHVCPAGQSCQNGHCKPGQPQQVCGDGVREGTEVCDGADLGGNNCTTIGMGFIGGALACAPNCQAFNTSACTAGPTCGDGVKNGSEQCDGSDLGGQTCSDFGYANPAGLACAGNCVYDTSGCTAVCGNATIEPGEVCDGSNLNGQTCQSLGFASGSLACSANCQTFDTSGCVATDCSSLPNGHACSDGNLCTVGDTCQGGVCGGGAPVICTAQDECHNAGVCNPGTGTCSNPAKPNGTACAGGTCQGGVCTP